MLLYAVVPVPPPQSDSVKEDHGPVKTKTPKPKEKKTPGPPPWANPGGQDKKDED